MDNNFNQQNNNFNQPTPNGIPPYNQSYPPPISPEMAEKKRFNKLMYKIFGGNLLYDAIMLGVIFGVAIVFAIGAAIVQIVLEKPESFYDDLFAWFENTDMGSSIAVFIGCFFLALFMRKVVNFREIFKKRQAMNPKSFFIILTIFYGGQFIFTLIDAVFESMLNLVGYTAQEAVEAATSGSTSLSMLFYAGFVAPVFEEIIYRGFMMQSLEKTGLNKGYAILVSSILFGVMHGNFAQAPFAFVVGMILGYTAMEYGIIWSILLHFLNNFVLGEGLTLILGFLPENVGNLIEIGFLAGLTAAAIALLIIKRREVSAYIKENHKVPMKYYKWTFSNPLFIIFCVIYFFMSFSTITKL
ncbi:MAG: CPBP family intramembrane metalloprotease [Ruminococcus sp.]|nr:CPBP family intramembrane metalloprotease [Ruminococcus sp.]